MKTSRLAKVEAPGRLFWHEAEGLRAVRDYRLPVARHREERVRLAVQAS